MRRLLRIIPLLVIVTAAWLISTNHLAIADWWFLRNYEPPSHIAAIADRTQMTEEARRYFYASDPKLNDKQSFNKNCPFEERSFVLGCYTSERNIYILDVKEKELDGIEDVTSVHEMLHAAYDRLSFYERNEVNEMLTAAYEQLEDKRLRGTIGEYQKHDPYSFEDELHSILATEVESLPEELEEYYSQYFTDGRQATIEAFQDYEAVFADLKNKSDRLKVEINELKSEIQALRTKLDEKQAELEQVNAQMERHKRRGETEEYNALVPRQNRLAQEYNGILSTLQAKTSEHNSKVKTYNSLVYRQNDLIDAINSKEQ